MLSKAQEERDLYRKQLSEAQAAVEDARAEAAKAQQEAAAAVTPPSVSPDEDENPGDDELSDLLICLGQEEVRSAMGVL